MFHYRSPGTKNYSIYSYARICVEMDFRKGFPKEMNLKGDDYLWTQKLDYDKNSFWCRVCFGTGHLETYFPGDPKKYRKQRKPTWQVGSHIDHQLISKEDSIDAFPSKEVPKGDPLLSSDVESPDLDPPLEVSKSEMEDKKVTTQITEKYEMQQENPWKLEEKLDSTPIDLGKETRVHPNSTTWVNL